MAKNDENINEILLELNKTLSKLTGKELKVATVEFKAPSKEALAAAAKAADEKQKKASSGQKPEEVKTEPAPVKMLKASVPPSVIPAIHPEIKKQIVIEQREKQQTDVKQKPEESKEKKTTPEKVKDDSIPSDIAPEQIFRLSVYYASGSADLIEPFFQNLDDVLHKTTKKRYYINREIITEADYSVINLKQAVAAAKEKSSDAVFFISNEPVEVEAEGIYCRNILSEQVKKRFFYVDLVVELVLAKRK